MTGIDLAGQIEPVSGLGAAPGGTIQLHVLDPQLAGAPANSHRWTLLTVQQPSIVYPLYGPNYPFTPWATVASGVGGNNVSSFNDTLLYAYKQAIPDNSLSFATPVWQHSVCGGICYLDRAGEWWVGLDAVVPVTVAIIPIFAQWQADAYLRGRRPNTRHMVRMDAAASGTGTGALGLIFGWDIRRRGYWIQNNAGASFSVKFGDSGTGPLIPLASGALLRVGPDESPNAPVFGEMAAGGSVANGLTLVSDLL